MSKNTSSLSGDSFISTWLEHPVGGPIIRDLLVQAGQDADTLRPVRRLQAPRHAEQGLLQCTDDRRTGTAG